MSPAVRTYRAGGAGGAGWDGGAQLKWRVHVDAFRRMFLGVRRPFDLRPGEIAAGRADVVLDKVVRAAAIRTRPGMPAPDLFAEATVEP
jgi:hypothetical protein